MGRAGPALALAEDAAAEAATIHSQEPIAMSAPALAVVSDAPTGSELVAHVGANPGLVILDRERFNQFYEAVKAETDQLVPDLTTERGRKEIASMAFKVTKTKTAIDAAGKLLKEEAQATVTKVDAARREIRIKLESLADEVRKPLTEWEAAEEARVEKVREFFFNLRQAGQVSVEETAAQIESRLSIVREHTLDQDFDRELFRERIEEVRGLRGDVIAALETALARIQREEADRAELERLRAEAAEREAQERAEAEAKAAAEAEARAKQEAEERAARAEAEEQARIAAAAKAAEDAARLAAEAKANEERLAAERAHAEALAAEKRRADEAEAARKAEADRIAAEKAAADKRAADIEHRGKIMGAAKQAIMGHGVGESTAKAIVLAIAAGDVPAVSIQF